MLLRYKKMRKYITTAFAFIISILVLTNLNPACFENEAQSVSSPTNDVVKAKPTELPITGKMEKIEKLKAMVIEKPTLVSSLEQIKTMREAAETKQDEALHLLVKCLAYNHDPDSRNEILSQTELIPAISIIKEFYGEKAGESLYKEALSTDKKWLIDRISLAVKAILSDEKTKALNAQFKVDSSNPAGNYFAEVLAKDKLEITFARRDDEILDKLGKKLQEIQEKKKPN
jgi:hypothetical protein